jgi:CDP-glycerol glycerophosphotransferase
LPESKVCVTGYARTDRLVLHTENIAAVRSNLGLPAEGKVVLFAPTWQQDTRGRSIYPFGADESTFLEALSSVARRHGATIATRAHLNTSTASGRSYEHVVAVPQGEFPDTEAVLLVSDVLVCDWSSISFDYMLLRRPTIFLDVPPPFRKGFSLGPEYRFGIIVKNVEGLLERLEEYLRDSDSYWAHAGQRHQDVLGRIYDRFADGRAGERCIERLAFRTGFRPRILCHVERP